MTHFRKACTNTCPPCQFKEGPFALLHARDATYSDVSLLPKVLTAPLFIPTLSLNSQQGITIISRKNGSSLAPDLSSRPCVAQEPRSIRLT